METVKQDTYTYSTSIDYLTSRVAKLNQNFRLSRRLGIRFNGILHDNLILHSSSNGKIYIGILKFGCLFEAWQKFDSPEDASLWLEDQIKEVSGRIMSYIIGIVD